MSALAGSMPSPAVVRTRLSVRGVVQGVGFRPFVFRLATRLGLSGWVCNSPDGVLIEIEGPRDRGADFVLALEREAPPRAVVEHWEATLLEPIGSREFLILPSLSAGEGASAAAPDGATCEGCLREILDPANRRYRYPFTNCTACGPRFSILLALPYDRLNTTMAGFEMCPACRREFDDPRDRRFHAQPNACPACGPQLALFAPDGAVLAERDAALSAAAEALRQGSIVALKGLGGFQLLVDARNEAAVLRLRRLKHRDEKPLAVMAPSLEWVRANCELSPLEAGLLSSPEAPIVLLRRLATPAEPVALAVAPGNPYTGVMLPTTPLHHLLMAELGFPVVATSGNRSGEPLCTENGEARERLRGIADLFLVHNRSIARPLDDSVARVVAGRPLLLRRARGYAPLSIDTGRPLPPVYATGAHQKNTAALTSGEGIVLSQHLGDLETTLAVTAHQETVRDLTRLYREKPRAVVCDLHPDYASTRVAEQLARVECLPLVRVQHHHAHVLACMAENRLEGPALGVCWDGTGLGTDGTVWGGEFLRVDAGDWSRAAHFRTFPLPGGDRAAREPRRAALGLLYALMGPVALEGEDLAPVQAFTIGERRILKGMLERRVQTPVTSSAGRLFDAIASLLDLRQRSGFEGQAAMALEFAAMDCDTAEAYPFTLHEGGGEEPAVVDWEPIVGALLEERRGGASASVVAAKLHNTLAEIVVEVARRGEKRPVVLTGGCFQNRILTERTVERLTSAGFEPFWHRLVPPNDGGIALGQVMAAAYRPAGA